jgi:hypothetical protein
MQHSRLIIKGLNATHGIFMFYGTKENQFCLNMIIIVGYEKHVLTKNKILVDVILAFLSLNISYHRQRICIHIYSTYFAEFTTYETSYNTENY